MNRLPLRISLVVACLAGTQGAWPDTPAPPRFEGAVDVRAVNVEAVVIDRRGVRVSGLGASDFVLRVDGREVAIDYFTEVREGVAVQPRPEVEGAGAETASTPTSVNYLVFLDDDLAIQAQRDLVLRRVADDLRQLDAEDRVAIVSWDGRKLSRLLDWTEDKSAIESAFADALRRPSWGGWHAATGEGDGGLSALGGYDVERRGMLAAAAAMRGLASPPGRKVVLILSPGWPAPAQAGPLASGAFLDVKANADFYEFYRPATDAANLLGYSIYPVDLSGFAKSELYRAPRAGMEQMARETGGRAILYGARLHALEQVARDAETYYGLGFSPDWRADGKRHEVRLEVRRPGLKVRARRDFSDLAKPAEVALRNEALLLFGGEEASRRLQLRAGEPVRAGVGKVSVPLTLDLPAASLTALPQADGVVLQGTLSMQALDRWGKRTDLGLIQLRISGPGAPEEGDTARYETRVVLPKGAQHLVAIVRDDAGEGEAWGTLEVQAVVRR